MWFCHNFTDIKTPIFIKETWKFLSVWKLLTFNEECYLAEARRVTAALPVPRHASGQKERISSPCSLQPFLPPCSSCHILVFVFLPTLTSNP